MKSTDIIQPKAITAPLAYEGTRFDIPETSTVDGKATVSAGFPTITMKALKDGGLPPRGEDCNGMFYLSTDQRVYLQNGGLITFNQAVSDTIGGYPAGAVLDYIDGNDIYYKVKSLIDDNTNNFVLNPALIDDVKWKIVNSAGTGAMRNIGETVFSLLPLNDAGLHLLDGSLISGTGAYAGFVAKIAQLYGDGNNVPAYFTTETLWQQSVTNYGVCGKFVYNSTANTVRLPKVTGIVEGTLDANALGDLVQAGLPALNTTGAHTHSRGTMEITGALNKYTDNSGYLWGNGSVSGAFSRSSATTGSSGISSTGGSTYGINFNASNSWTGSTSSNGSHTHTFGANIGTSNTVQPQTVKGFLYIVIANSVKTDIEVDIDNVMTDLNGKMDKDYKNATIAPLVQTQITNCILEAPNGVVTYSGGSTTVKAGLKVLIPNGRNPDKTLKNIEYTVPADVTTNEPNGNRELILSSTGALNSIIVSNILQGKDSDKPTTVANTANTLYYAEDTNLMYLTSGSTTASWYLVELAMIGKFTKTNDVITSLEPYSPFHAADARDLDGIWTKKNLTVASNVDIPVGTNGKNYDLSSYLPNDDNPYEVIIYCSVNAGNTANSRATAGVGGSLFLSVHAYAQTSVTNIPISSSSRGIVVIQPDRQLKMSLTGSVSQGKMYSLTVDGYRKVR